jgi:hypothetical protein
MGGILINIVGAALAAAILISLTPFSASANYLDELEQEAARSFGPSDTTTSDTPTPGSRSNNAVRMSEDRVDPGLSKSEFEQALRDNFYGSHLFYSALNPVQQQAVYDEYNRNNDIDHLREIIKEQMK